MKIQCDVCEKAPATLICCADEAALCAKCDVEVHAANKLASKHQRLLLQSLSTKLPPCDICQEKVAFIFCVEDRALFCQDCDESIHSANTRAANHQRFLATGIRVALSTSSKQENMANQIVARPPKHNSQDMSLKSSTQNLSTVTSSSWAVDELFHLSDYETSDKKEQLEFGELEWLTDSSLFDEQMGHESSAAAEVPQLGVPQANHSTSYRTPRFSVPYKKARIELPEDDEEYFLVPDLG